MNNENIIVRKAKPEDMPQVMNLIKELAKFEKLENQVKITADVLVKDAFDTEQPAFHCLVAEKNNHVLGYALYFIAYSTWRGKSIFLEDLYVQPAYRKLGAGKQLFTAVAKIAHETKSQRLDFHVLSWNPAKDFYETLGAENLTTKESWQLYRLDEEALNKIFAS